VQRAIIRRVGPVAIVCCLLLTCAGCCGLRPRHGLIVRGDWSLELNRIPWLASRGGEYQAPGAPCLSGETMSPADAGQGASVLPAVAQMCGPQCVGQMCNHRGTRRSPVAVAKPAAGPGYHNHPRFHPVPSQPVFSPRADRFPSVSGGTSSPAYPEPGLGAPPNDGATPQKQLPPEEIPTPPPSSSTAAQAETAEETSKSSSWIFTGSGSASGELEPPPVAAQAQKTREWKRAVR